jgi:NAD(P)-dependent dehydrogenase (short-subunit alcohol dehydrogenase family)
MILFWKITEKRKEKLEMSTKKVAVVTGAGQGIGLAGARKFAEEGWAVALIDLKEHPLQEETEKLKAEYSDVECYTLDISDYAAGKDTVARIVERFGRIDALFNNAGITGHRLDILHCDPEEIKKATDVNVFGSLYMTQHVANVMVEKEIKGAIVNVASIAAELASWDPFGYQISKYGVKGLTKATAFQLGVYGIRVNAVAPGTTRTPMAEMDWSDPVISKIWESQNVLHKWLEPSEIANAAFFLASDQASGVTGHIMMVDAGYSITKSDNRKSIYE